ncbi:MAG: hypothetical protein AAF411_26935 [Myxococcota bacterium]
MRRACLAVLAVTFLASAPVRAQRCTVQGFDLRFPVRVSDGRRVVKIEATWEKVRAELRSETARVAVQGWLRVSGRTPRTSLSLVYLSPVEARGIFWQSGAAGARLSEGRVQGNVLHARVASAGFETEALPLACDSLVLSNRTQDTVRSGNEEGLSDLNQRHGCWWPWGEEGLRRAFQAPPAATRETGEAVETREFRLVGRDSFRVHEAPGSRRSVRFYRTRGAMSLPVVESRRGWRRVLIDTPDLHLGGWVHASRLVSGAANIGLGNLGTIGHGGGSHPTGRSAVVQPETPIRLRRSVRARVVGFVQGAQTVFAREHGEWTEVVSSDALRLNGGNLWVPTGAVTFGVSTERGTTLRRSVSADGVRVVVEATDENSPAYRMLGLRVGDEIVGMEDSALDGVSVPEAHWRQTSLASIRRAMNRASLRVLRSGKELRLDHPCGVAQRAERSVARDAPFPPACMATCRP